MAIKWRPLKKRSCVKQVLRAHPAKSSRCAEAAEMLLPIAKTQDGDAHFWLLRPSPYCGPLAMIKKGLIGILPNIPEASKWTHHVCVETQRHCVCALSGASGTPRKQYISLHFQYPEDVVHMELADANALSQAISEIG